MTSKFVYYAAVFLSISSVSALSETTDWMDANEFEKFGKKVLLKGNIPTNIRCKAQNVTRGLTRKNTLLKISYKRNPDNDYWVVGWGANVTMEHNRLSKRGFSRVSFYQTVRKSGLKLPCAIWQKKR